MPSAKTLFLCQGFLGQMGDRMWLFAAYLLLAKVFPERKIILGGIYGLSIAVSAALLSSTIGIWIDKTHRLQAAITLMVIQNASVALAAIIQICGMYSLEFFQDYNYLMIGLVTLLGCTGMLASIGTNIVLERDWIPQVFRGEDLTSVNAWIRRIDQGAMLLGPALSGFIISHDPRLGAACIALWNMISLVFEIAIMRSIYSSTEALQVSKDISASYDLKVSFIEWRDSWSYWSRSPVFIPGLALALLYANVFQLSYIAQAYIASHCISDNLMAIVWVASGFFGLLGTALYEVFVHRWGLSFAATVGGVLHISFVFGTIGGLFIEGSPYAVYAQSLRYDIDKCPAVLSPEELNNLTDIIRNEFVLNYETSCTPPSSLWSIGVLIACCGLSRCGLWLFDLAVNQMFQEWVQPDKRGTVSGAQNGCQYLFDCVHFGIVFIWSEQCEFGHAMIATCILMTVGYTNLFISVGMGKFSNVTCYLEDSPPDYTSIEKKSISSRSEEDMML